jgi:large conductance mechanosensitive channel
MSVVKEFKEFALRGNVADLAIAIVIGSAFGKIVTSLVGDVIMPPIGMLVGGINFTDIKFKMKNAVIDAAGKVASPAVTINLGNFLQTIFDFIIVAFAIFMLVKMMNRMKKKGEVVTAPEVAPVPSNQEVLLAEIRDLLKK